MVKSVRMTTLALAVAVVVAMSLTACSSNKGGTGATPTVTVPASPSATQPPPTPTPVPTVKGVLPDPSATPIPLPNTAEISAPTNDIAWVLVAGVRLFSSTDRGTTWQARGLPPSIANAEIAFINDKEGWISSVGSPATQCQQQSLALWHTTDAGANWAQLQPSGIAAGQCKTGLSFTDAKHGFVSAYDPNHAPVVYRTSDGGQTWTASSPLADPPGFTTQPGANSLQPGTVVTRGVSNTLLLPARGGNAQYVYRSTDQGATWTYVATAPSGEAALALPDVTRWLMILNASGSMETTDSGATWHAFTTDYSQAAPIAPVITFGGADVGYATVRGGIQRTTDGGAHWTRIGTPGTLQANPSPTS